MKYKILAIEHAVGEFTPTTGKNAGKECHYDVYRLHTIKRNKENIGGWECNIVRATPDQMGMIVADCGGTVENCVNRTLDMEVRNSFGKINLTDYEVLD